MTMRVGVLGTGRMGLPLARNLRRAGYVVRVFDGDDDRRRAARGEGLALAASSADLASSSDVLLTVLPGPAECAHAVRGALPHLCPGSLWLDLTSNDPRVATELALEAAAAGIGAVGAPMRGGPHDIEARTVGFFLGGSAGDVARVVPILRRVGEADRIVHVGPGVGDGHAAKLLANTLWFGQVAAVAECLLLGQALGLDLATLRDVLRNSPGTSAFVIEHLDALLAGDYLESFGIDRVVEELQTVLDLADEMRSPVDVTRAIADLHRAAAERFGPVPGELLAAKLLEERAGRTLRIVPGSCG